LFQVANLLVEEVIGQFDQTDHYVCGNGGVGVLDSLPEGRVVGVWLAV
jgi:hypothetical protein